MNKITEQPLLTRRNKLVCLCSIGVLILVYLITSNNYRFYKETILKVTKTVNEATQNQVGVNGNEEQYYRQKITGRIMNGSRKGETITFDNSYSYSEVFMEKYKKGDRLFIKFEADNSVTIQNVKRDSYIVLLLSVLVLSLLLISKRQGFFTILSLIINISTFYLCLSVFHLGQFLDWVWIALVFFFTFVTLLLTSGIHKKTFGAILSALATFGIVYVVYYFFVWKDDTIPYEMISYAYGPLPLKNIYMVSVIFGSLGAIMDVSITIHSSVSELIAATPDITLRKLIRSIQEIGYDIMGTMVNVMFFSYLSSSLPIAILKMQSGFGLGVIYRYEYIFEMIRFLLAAIGIVLAIPVSGFIATLFVWKGLKHQK